MAVFSSLRRGVCPSQPGQCTDGWRGPSPRDPDAGLPFVTRGAGSRGGTGLPAAFARVRPHKLRVVQSAGPWPPKSRGRAPHEQRKTPPTPGRGSLAVGFAKAWSPETRSRVPDGGNGLRVPGSSRPQARSCRSPARRLSQPWALRAAVLGPNGSSHPLLASPKPQVNFLSGRLLGRQPPAITQTGNQP